MKCDTEVANNCQTKMGSNVQYEARTDWRTLVFSAGGVLYIGQGYLDYPALPGPPGDSVGMIVSSCDHFSSTDCKGSPLMPAAVTAMAYGDAMLFAGASNGDLLKCDPGAGLTCVTLYKSPSVEPPTGGSDRVWSLLFQGGFLYAGLDSGKMLMCDVGDTVVCQVGNNTDGYVDSLVYANGAIFAGIFVEPNDKYPGGAGILSKCKPGSLSSCVADWFQVDTPIRAILYANGGIFVWFKDALHKCDPSAPGKCSTFSLPDNSSGEWGVSVMTFACEGNGHSLSLDGSECFDCTTIDRNCTSCPENRCVECADGYIVGPEASCIASAVGS